MDKYFSYAFFLLVIVLESSCLRDIRKSDFKDDSLSAEVCVTMDFPESYTGSKYGFNIVMKNRFTGTETVEMSDDDGTAVFRVPYGIYTASVNGTDGEDGKKAILNGVSEEIMVAGVSMGASGTCSASLPVNISYSSPIVIKEAYFGGMLNPLNNRNYTKDAYFILYNNSGSDVFLDGLCFATIDPYNSTNTSSSIWVKNGTSELRDSLPVSSIGWMFPGSGTDYPLSPGEEVVLCLNAINHEKISPEAVNLAVPGYWALYDRIYTPDQSEPSAGTRLMKAFWKASLSDIYIVSVSSPAFFLYRIEGMTTGEFVASCLAPNPKKPENRAFDCLMVDKLWVLDGVECMSDPLHGKRMRPEVDNGFVLVSEGLGQSICRKIDEEASKSAGRVVYMDTNNSSSDFEILPSPSLKIKNRNL